MKIQKIKCPRCGKKARKKDRFCSQCGQHLIKNTITSRPTITTNKTDDDIPGTPQEKKVKNLTLIFYSISIVPAFLIFCAFAQTNFKELSHFLDSTVQNPMLENGLANLYKDNIIIINFAVILYMVLFVVQGMSLYNMCKDRNFSVRAKFAIIQSAINSAVWFALPFLIDILLTKISDFEATVSVMFRIISVIIAVSEIMCAVMCRIAAKYEKNSICVENGEK